jgi:hypothetical protein
MNKKELAKGFKIIIDDLLDNYDKYTDEEKDQIKELFQKASELNTILDKYDIETQFDWNEYFTALAQCLDAMR